MKGCTRHWLLLRFTSLPLIPLFFYFLMQAEHLVTKDRMAFIQWAKQPITTSAIVLFIICAFYHAQLGMEEIIIDYIPAEKQRMVALLLNKAFFSILGIAAVYAALALHFGKS